MIGYVTLGTNDLQVNAGFYDALAAELGAGRIMDFDTFVVWGQLGGSGAGISLVKPYDGNTATVGNGTMAALQAKDPEQVRRLHEIALANGGSDEGAPGPRGEPDAQGNTFYAAYFRDREGNKLNAFCMVRDQ